MIYGLRSNGNNHGLVLTKATVVNAMLDRVGYSANFDLKNTKVIEPAAGEGAFAIEIITRLYKSSLKFNFSFQEALSNIVFYEIDNKICAILTQRIETLLSKFSAFTPKRMIREEDFLLTKTVQCDLIIGNPPYVRHENIPENQKNIYRKTFSTFTHRSDLYIAFYEKSLKLLAENGTLSFICSNRWLKNQYGKGLRDLIHFSYSLDEIIDLEKTSPFEEKVIAYPAITTIRNIPKKTEANYYRLQNLQELYDLNKGLSEGKTVSTASGKPWFTYQPTNENLYKSLDSIENQGFKIGIGVATGADKIFIRKDFSSLIEEELLIPILTSKDLRNNEFNWSGNYILNPFDSTGNLIELSMYPKANAYLNSHKDRLKDRHVAKKNPLAWYKTIDKIKPSLTHQYKIVLPDISGNKFLFIDEGKHYPHHNLYYITGANQENLVILATILISNFVKDQLLELGTTMNGGYPRWQSQNLKKLRIPIISAIPIKVRDQLISAYYSKNYDKINTLITESEITNYTVESGQTKLLESESRDYMLNSLKTKYLKANES